MGLIIRSVELLCRRVSIYQFNQTYICSFDYSINFVLVQSFFMSLLRMRKFILLLLLVVVAFIFFSCDNKNNKAIEQYLVSLDLVIDSSPQQVVDSLNTIDTDNLSRHNQAHYNLLKVISDDKTYVNFTSDSLINSVSEYYRLNDPKSKNYIRALAYQGIVRTRMGVRDSTVYEPLREADKLLETMTPQDPSLGYLVNYFLGNVHYINRNYPTADNYFQRTLSFAKEEEDSIHIFDTYLALYWNEMEQRNYDKGVFYLDYMSSFYNKLPGKDYFILNAQSIYYDIIGEPEKALNSEKTKLVLYENQNENIDLSRVYFNISDRYVGLNQLDSAMFYGQLSIDMIEDSTHRQNYLYYQNVANIAERQGNYALSNIYLRSSFDLLNQSLRDRLDTQIAEMEKRYDLSEAENVILRTRQQNLVIIIAALILLMLISIYLMYMFKARKESKMKLMLAENKVEQQEMQAVLMREEAGKRKWLILLYSNISDRLTFLQGEFEKLTQKYVSSNPKVYKEMQKILKNTDTDLRDINKTLSPDDETFYAYTHLKDEKSIFNANEKMLLMLLACDADNRQLATFLNTTVESVRVRKSQLKKKMTENNYEVTLFDD